MYDMIKTKRNSKLIINYLLYLNRVLVAVKKKATVLRVALDTCQKIKHKAFIRWIKLFSD